ncbi:MAG: hypothetical protein IT364_18975 [Candidatus Hydrogenedentes bacterium]|nr:hypothetical protein [Candidatus Hydrogenedentota bacterium]
MEPELTLRAPRHFTMREAVMENLVAGGIALVSIFLVTSFFSLVAFVATRSGHLDHALLISICILWWISFVACSVLLLPLGCNIYTARLVRAYVDKPKNGGRSLIVQISLSPPLYDGTRHFMEDADDVGYLHFSEGGLTFVGDSISLNLPYEHIERIEDSNVGFRGLWVCGRRIRVYTRAVASYDSFEFLERQSFRLKTSQRVSGEILKALMMRTQLQA